jgi:hypothetical protein
MRAKTFGLKTRLHPHAPRTPCREPTRYLSYAVAAAPPARPITGNPRPKLRRAGFQNIKLGTDWTVAVRRRWRRTKPSIAGTPRTPTAPPARKPVKILRWRDLVAAYKADPAYLDLKPKSRPTMTAAFARSTFGRSMATLRLRDLDRDMISGLRNVLVKDPRKPRTAALLRVLRLVVNFGIGAGLARAWAGRRPQHSRSEASRKT